MNRQYTSFNLESHIVKEFFLTQLPYSAEAVSDQSQAKERLRDNTRICIQSLLGNKERLRIRLTIMSGGASDGLSNIMLSRLVHNG